MTKAHSFSALSWPAKAGHPGEVRKMWKTYYVYIVASCRNGTIYVGVTNDIHRRAWEHREGLIPGFTKTYGVKKLVYYESFDDIGMAIHREKRLKKWKRQWKIDLIQKDNVEWSDLYDALND
jgi:putative endonuclease